MYWIVRWHYGQPAALLAALALITNAYFHGYRRLALPGWRSHRLCHRSAGFLSPASWQSELERIFGRGRTDAFGIHHIAGAPMVLLVLLVIPLLALAAISRKSCSNKVFVRWQASC